MIKRVFPLFLIVFSHMEQISATDAPFRLPETVVPVHYRLDLEIVPDAPRFGGVVEIDLRVVAPTDTIWLHGNGLAVAAVSLRTSDGRDMRPSGMPSM